MPGSARRRRRDPPPCCASRRGTFSNDDDDREFGTRTPVSVRTSQLVVRSVCARPSHADRRAARNRRPPLVSRAHARRDTTPSVPRAAHALRDPVCTLIRSVRPSRGAPAVRLPRRTGAGGDRAGPTRATTQPVSRRRPARRRVWRRGARTPPTSESLTLDAP